MVKKYFSALNDNQLLDAYEEYRKFADGEAPARGVFQTAAQALEQAHPGRGTLLAANELLEIMARAWYLSLRPIGKILDVDDDVWVVQFGEVKEARVVRVVPDGEDYIYWIQPYDTELYEEYPEKYLGTRFFTTELAANRWLEEQENN